MRVLPRCGGWFHATCLGLAMVGLVLAPAFADVVDGVEVVQGGGYSAGASGRAPLTPPGGDFADPTAESSNSGVATANGASNDGVNFTVGNTSGITVITVTWTNKKTGEKKRQFVVVNTGPRPVDHVHTHVFVEGQKWSVFQGSDTLGSSQDPARKPGTYVTGWNSTYYAHRGFNVTIESVVPASEAASYAPPKAAPPAVRSGVDSKPEVGDARGAGSGTTPGGGTTTPR